MVPVGCGPACLFGEFLHGPVTYDGPGGEGRAQHKPFQRPAAAQSHICLTVGEGGGGIYDCTVKCQALTLVDGDGPRQLDWVLPEYPVYFFPYFLGLLVEYISGVGPFLLLEDESFGSTAAAYFYPAGGDFCHLADHPVEITVLSGSVVFHEHYLRSLLQFEGFFRRERIFREFPFHFGPEHK